MRTDIPSRDTAGAGVTASLPRVLIFGRDSAGVREAGRLVSPAFAPVLVQETWEALQALRTVAESDASGWVGVWLQPGAGQSLAEACLLPGAGGLAEQLEEGLAVLDLKLEVLWSNTQFARLAGLSESPVGRGFEGLFEGTALAGSDPAPFHNALEESGKSRSRVRLTTGGVVQIVVQPVEETPGSGVSYFVLTVRDISAETDRQQKLHEIFEAGLQLGDLSPEDLRETSVENRIELLKSQIIGCTEGVLRYETVEIRLLEPETQRLVPLLNVGMLPEAAARELRASPTGNGVTGFVAAQGQSYLCEDSQRDPLYLRGAEGARSSLTVPLKWNDQVLGTFNVESRQPGAFTMQDLQFLELFGREVAVALHRLNLLAAERVSTAAESSGRILAEVAQPVDDVLNHAAWILEKYIGHEPEVAQRLQQILREAREIRQKIQRAGAQLAPARVAAGLAPPELRVGLSGKRVLVADNDDQVRQKAHELLAPQGCEVETAHNGAEALLMVRLFAYDAVLADIRLPDMSGYECFRQIRELRSEMPIILMTGFGYDPGHSIVKARELGLRAVLYKPFRQEMFLNEVERAAQGYGGPLSGAGGTSR